MPLTPFLSCLAPSFLVRQNATGLTQSGSRGRPLPRPSWRLLRRSDSELGGPPTGSSSGKDARVLALCLKCNSSGDNDQLSTAVPNFELLPYHHAKPS